jgi:hypothetical protein
MRTMTDDEVWAFLASGPTTGILATTTKLGRPHAVPIWFVVDGREIVFTTWHEAAKTKHIRRDSRVAFCVDDQTPPFSFVSIEGDCTLSDDLDELRRWATAIGGRAMGADQAEAFGVRNAVTGELLGRIHPTKVISRAEMAA